jgi:hypothetical protein
VSFGDDHVGRQCMGFLQRMLMLGPEHVEVHADGFSFWPGAHEVRFRWREPGVGALPVWRVSVEVPVFRGVDAESALRWAGDALFGRLLNQFSVAVVGDVMVWRSMVLMIPGGSWGPLFQLLYRAAFVVATVRQRGAALRRLLGRRNVFGWVGPELAIDVPRAAIVPADDNALSEFLAFALQEGKSGVAAEQAEELASSARLLRSLMIGPVAEDTDGALYNIVVETSSVSSLIELRTREANPHVGAGLLMVLRARFAKERTHAVGVELARALNDAEWVTTWPLTVQGTWTGEADGAEISYSVFYPKALLVSGVPQEVALDAVRRFRWMCDALGYGDSFTDLGPHARHLLGIPEKGLAA